jgi:hypothetical protein
LLIGSKTLWAWAIKGGTWDIIEVNLKWVLPLQRISWKGKGKHSNLLSYFALLERFK